MSNDNGLLIFDAVRHGQTTANRDHILQGHAEYELTELGEFQAGTLGIKLSAFKYDFVWCSDLGRCRRTLEEIAQECDLPPATFAEELREINLGELQGQNSKGMDWQALGDSSEYRPQGGESVFDVRVRIERFLRSLALGTQHLLVTHGGPICEMMNLAKGHESTSISTRRIPSQDMIFRFRLDPRTLAGEVIEL